MRLQEIIDELRRDYAHIEFIWITAPTERCGITLLQRMFNAGSESVIYGENTYLLSGLPYRLIHMFGDETVSAADRQTREVAQVFFGGRRGIDGTMLWPDYRAYVKEVLGAFYRLIEFYQNESNKRGFKYWGIKCPLRERGDTALSLLRLLPSRQMIIVERGLTEIAKSMYARWPEQFPDAAGFRRLGRRWMSNRALLRRFTGDKVLRINYEWWMQNPNPVADQIEHVFGVRVSRDEILNKINMHDHWNAAARGAVTRGVGHYLPPRELPAGAELWLKEGVQDAIGARPVQDS